jgi:hypothetical protein
MSGPVTRRELAARTVDGLDVRLLWDPADDRVAVTVADAREGLALEVPVHPAESPLDVFRHPFAYAAVHGVAPRPAVHAA